jgi:hypothetical protein
MDLYRSSASIWIDVFGTVLVGAVLLGGAGYLLSNIGNVTGGLGGNGPEIASRSAPPAPQAKSGFRGRRPAPASRSPSIMREGAPAPSGSGAEVPFSDGWQSQATPELTGPTGSGGAGSSGVPSGGAAIGEGAIGDGTAESDGPTIASRRPQGSLRNNSARTGSEGAAWRSEARKLSGQARALSNQLGQMERAGPEEEAQSSREAPAAKTSDGRGKASVSSDPGTPEDPDQVPIGNHLHWLLAAGVLWGIWRLS